MHRPHRNAGASLYLSSRNLKCDRCCRRRSLIEAHNFTCHGTRRARRRRAHRTDGVQADVDRVPFSRAGTIALVLLAGLVHRFPSFVRDLPELRFGWIRASREQVLGPGPLDVRNGDVPGAFPVRGLMMRPRPSVGPTGLRPRSHIPPALRRPPLREGIIATRACRLHRVHEFAIQAPQKRCLLHATRRAMWCVAVPPLPGAHRVHVPPSAQGAIFGLGGDVVIAALTGPCRITGPRLRNSRASRSSRPSAVEDLRFRRPRTV